MAKLNAAGVVVQLADGPHVLKFDTNRLINVEEHFGSFTLVQDQLKQSPLSTNRRLLYEGFGRELALEEIGTLMDGISMKSIDKAVGEALVEAMPPTDPDEVDPTPPAPKPELELAPTPSSG